MMVSGLFVSPLKTPQSSVPLDSRDDCLVTYNESSNFVEPLIGHAAQIVDITIDPAEWQSVSQLPSLQQKCDFLGGHGASVESANVQQSTPSTSEMETHAHPLLQEQSELSSFFLNGIIKCPDCPGNSKIFTNITNFRKHKVKFHNHPRFMCVVCSAPFENYKLLLDHMVQLKHSIQCPLCSQTFLRPTDASGHFTYRHKTFVCSFCGLSTQGKACYLNHLRVFHNEAMFQLNRNSNFSDCQMDDDNQGYLAAPSFVDVTLYSSSCEVFEGSESPGSITHQPNENISNLPPDSTSLLTEFSDNPLNRSMVNVNAVGEDNIYTTEYELQSSSKQSATSTGDNETGSFNHHLYLDRDSVHEETIMFGPGADELLEEDDFAPPQVSSAFNEKNVQWAGHDLEMCQNISEKHKKTYRFKCGKCPRSFQNREMLKRHAKVHEHICKRCFQKFDSLEEVRKHKKVHRPTLKALKCLACSKKFIGPKNLMVHEMLHRLDVQYKRKLEEVIKQGYHAGPPPVFHKCSKCTKLIDDFEIWIRHEVWHEYSDTWDNYTQARVAMKLFSREDKKQLEKPVEVELMRKWVGFSKPEQVEQGSTSPCSILKEARTAEVKCHKENECDNESDIESEFSEEGLNFAVNGWMEYWQSYLGIKNSPPSWVSPILRKLRLQWKLYHIGELEIIDLYKQMDQISYLIRAQRNEVLPFEGHKVVLKRLPQSLSVQKLPPTSKSLKLSDVGRTLSFQVPKVVLQRLPESLLVQKDFKFNKATKQRKSSMSTVGKRLKSPDLRYNFRKTPNLTRTCQAPSESYIACSLKCPRVFKRPVVLLERLPLPEARPPEFL